MTNNPKKRAGLEGYGLEIVEQVPLKTEPNRHNVKYLRTKAEKLGHQLELRRDGGAERADPSGKKHG
jgi:3,4-dihydroxy 2-butanone 4-phosphate synthase/GTP cyclohydrolase II